MSDLDQVKQQLDVANANLKQLVAKLHATEQLLNENLQSNLQLRTMLVLSQQEAHVKDQNVKNLGDQVKALSEKVAELSKPVEQPDAA